MAGLRMTVAHLSGMASARRHNPGHLRRRPPGQRSTRQRLLRDSSWLNRGLGAPSDMLASGE